MYHRVLIIGNLGGDPQMRYMPSGDPVTTFNVATNERWTDQNGQQQERTIWWRVSVFGRQAEVCNQYLTKGRQVLVEGTMQADPNTGGPRIWTRQDGTPAASFEVRARMVRFIGSRAEAAAPGPAVHETGAPPAYGEEIETEEDLPF
jgi:single-strand DNA-binding protein